MSDAQEKCALCGAPVQDWTDKPGIWSGLLDIPVSERRAIRAPNGKLYCAAYKYCPPLTCICLHDRREAEKELREEFDIHCPECENKKPRMLWCGDCDGNAWLCPKCGHEWPDEGNPCYCHEDNEDPGYDESDYSGAFDGFTVTSDADPGL